MAARKFTFRLVPAIVTLGMVAALLGLGVWQLQRLEWKTALLARIDAQMAAAPVPLPENPENPADWEFRRVTMAGQYLYDREFMVGPRTLDGRVGFHMVVPFRRASGGIVFVNRGWITPELRKKADRPEGIVQVEGIVQLPHKSRFTPDNAPDKKNWYWIDTAVMAQDAKLAAPAPFIIDTPRAAAGVYPAGGALVLDIPNDHLQYAIFWFGMAAAAFAVFVLSSLKPAAKPDERIQHASV